MEAEPSHMDPWQTLALEGMADEAESSMAALMFVLTTVCHRLK